MLLLIATRIAAAVPVVFVVATLVFGLLRSSPGDPATIIAGETVLRPNGQRKLPTEDAPTFGPARNLDYELELGIFVGPGNSRGRPVPIAKAAEQVAGLCLLNDWSARDIQAWEYQPLGPFLAKNFATTVSHWVVTAEALAPFRIAQATRPDGDPRLQKPECVAREGDRWGWGQ